MPGSAPGGRTAPHGATARAAVAVACALAGLALSAASPAPAMPPGYFVDSLEAAAPRPARSDESDGEFTYSIRRGVPDSTAARLLGIAEATYPPRGLLIRKAIREGYEMGADTAGVPLWWCRGIGESRVPYAVTTGALAYYLDLTRHYRERDFRDEGTRPLFGSRLVYRGTIAERDSFVLGGTRYHSVYVAGLTLDWTFDDGTFLPLTEAHRVVVLSREGDVLAVGGDGAAREKVTISSHRGVGREEEILH